MAVKKMKNTGQSQQSFGFDQQHFELKKFLEIVCNIGVYVFLFFLVVVFSFYFKEGYTQIATNKFLFFKKMCITFGAVLIPTAIVHALVRPRFGAQSMENIMLRAKRAVSKWSFTDYAVLALLLVTLISYALTPYKEEALWGTDGWYMGLGTQICCIVIYFFMSRFYDGKLNILKYMMWTTFAVFGWGLLNRFSVYPIEMENAAPAFISSLGNINWFCGYWSVFFGIGVVMYWFTEEFRDRIFLGIYCAVALGIGAVEGSDSAYISLAVVFVILLLNSFKSTVRMERFLELSIIFTGMCQLMRVIYLIWPDSLNIYEGVIVFLLGNVTLIGLIMFVGLRIWIWHADRLFHRHTQIPGTYYLQKFVWVKKTIIIGMIGGGVLYFLMITMNTLHPGILGPLSNYGVFIFNDTWGSSRGCTWKDGIAIFQSLSPIGKLVGAGPDCFAAYAYDHAELSALFTSQFGGNRLTNAHNECITILANLGILGLAAFVCSFIGTAARSLKKAAKEPLCYIFAACLLSYFFHNMFSFEQITNVPFAYMMLGLAENQLRKFTS